MTIKRFMVGAVKMIWAVISTVLVIPVCVFLMLFLALGEASETVAETVLKAVWHWDRHLFQWVKTYFVDEE